MAYNYEYPYPDMGRYNADWLLRMMKDLAEEWAAFKPDILAQFEAFKAEVLANETAHKAEVQALIDAYQAEINGEIGALKSEMEKVLSDFAEFKEEITEKTDGYDEKIAAQNTKISALEESQTAQNTKISALEESQAAQDTKISTLESSQDSLADTVATHTGAISSLQITQQSHGEAIATLDQQVVQLSTSVTEMRGDITSQAGSIAAIENTLSDHATSISTLATTVTNHGTSIAQLTTEQNSLDDRVETLEDGQTEQDTQISGLDTRVSALESGGGGGGEVTTGPVIDVTTIPNWPSSGASIVNVFNAYTAAHPDHIMYFPAGSYYIDGGLQVNYYTICDKNSIFNMQDAASFIGYANGTANFIWKGGQFQWGTRNGLSLFFGNKIKAVDITVNGSDLRSIAYLYGTFAKLICENCTIATRSSGVLVVVYEGSGAARIDFMCCRIGQVEALVSGIDGALCSSRFASCVFSSSSWTNKMIRIALTTVFDSCSIPLTGSLNYDGNVFFNNCAITNTATLPGSGDEATLSFIGCNFYLAGDNPKNILTRTNSTCNTYGTTIIK